MPASNAWPKAHELYERLPLPIARMVPVLGVPVRFSTNSPAVIEAVKESFGSRRLATRTTPVVTVRIVVYDRDQAHAGHARMTWHIPDRRRAQFHGDGNSGMLDLDRRDGFAFVTPALVADRPHFRYGVLEALTLTTVNDCDRYPIHAGALVRNRSVLLLAGPSGVGKSTLVYAAMKAGAQVLTDDAIYVQGRPGFRIWGAPNRLYLRPEARRHFAEVRSFRTDVLSAGKTKLAVPVATRSAVKVPIAPRQVRVILLSRGTGPVGIRRVRPRAIAEALREDLRVSIDRHGKGLARAIDWVSRGGGWKLNLSSDPNEALPLIERVLDQLG